MMVRSFDSLMEAYERLLARPNPADEHFYNGLFRRYRNPVLTREHIPPFWMYDADPRDNPFMMQRLGVNATLNSGALKVNGKYCLVVRVEGMDRKSFFAVAESDRPTEGFRFRDYPVILPDTEKQETNVYDMRLTRHEDGWIYGVFCSESKDESSADLSAAVAAAGIVRTKDLETWERLPNLVTLRSPSSAMWCCIRNLWKANMPSIPARWTTLSTPVPAAASGLDYARILPIRWWMRSGS